MITQEMLVREYGSALRGLLYWQRLKGTAIRGSLQKKKINGQLYDYLVYRDGTRVISEYVEKTSVSDVAAKIAERKKIEEQILALKESLRLIERALGRHTASREHIRRTVEEVVLAHPEYCVRKVVLFGSRATAHFRDDSDVDLIVSFENSSAVSLLTMSGLRLELQDSLGIPVDLVSASTVETSMLEIHESEVIYAA